MISNGITNPVASAATRKGSGNKVGGGNSGLGLISTAETAVPTTSVSLGKGNRYGGLLNEADENEELKSLRLSLMRQEKRVKELAAENT